MGAAAVEQDQGGDIAENGMPGEEAPHQIRRQLPTPVFITSFDASNRRAHSIAPAASTTEPCFTVRRLPRQGGLRPGGSTRPCIGRKLDGGHIGVEQRRDMCGAL